MGAVSSKGKTKDTGARRAGHAEPSGDLDLVRVKKVEENIPRAVFTKMRVHEGRKEGL